MPEAAGERSRILVSPSLARATPGEIAIRLGFSYMLYA
jgi:hypothetical protein